MTHSSVATGIALTSDSGDRTGPMKYFIFHHAAGTNLSALLAAFQPGGRTVSANYAIKDRQCIVTVDEDRRAKTSGSKAYDGQAVTVEVCNSTGAPGWGISEESFDTLARLIGDWSRRYGIPINNNSVLGHRELKERFGVGYATACPMVLYNRKAELLERARVYAGQAAPVPGHPTPSAPAPTAPSPAGRHPNDLCVVDGDFGPQTIRKEQWQLGFRSVAFLDGINGPYTIKRRQAKLGQVQDGIENPGGPTIKAQQRHLGFTGSYVDGKRGPVTVTRLQQRMNAGTY